MAEMMEINSVQPRDPDLAKAYKTRRFKYFNLPFVACFAALVIYGLIVQFSATSSDSDFNFTTQVLGVVIGIVLFVLVSRFDYRALSGFTTFFVVINVVLLLSPHLPFIGREVNGANSWIRIGGFSMQPGEFAKITVVLLAASIMSRYGGRLDDLREYLKALGILFIPFLCVLTQLIIGGANWRFLVGTAAILVVLVFGIFMLDPILDGLVGSDVLLKDYQRSRLLVFMDSSYDLSGDGYNLQQAKIAIGSGGFFGKGFMQATQSSLGFLPEAPTDFVFCVLAEEFGFFGALALLALYLGLIITSIRVARNAPDLFGTIIVVCIVGMWVFQILENIGMDVGLMPITGIPLPFISYGSSFMLVNFVMLGLINSIWAHTDKTPQ